MTPEDTNASSGLKPEEVKAVRRPTIISPGGIQQAAQTVPPVKRLPTVIKPSAIIVPVVQSPATRVVQPAGPRKPVIIGTPIQRITVTLADLRGKNSTIKNAVLQQALQLLQAFSPDNADDKTAVYWGNKTQKDYSGLVSRSLELSKSDIVQKTSRHIARLMEILGLIRLEKVCGKNNEGFMTRMFGKTTGEIDTPSALERAQREIEEIVKLVSDGIDALLGLKTQFEQLSNEVGKVRDDAEALAIAGLVIADYLVARSRKDLADRFTERSMSLTATCAQIQGASSTRQLQVEQPLRLISVVQNVVLVTLPGLVGMIASIQTMTGGQNQPTITTIEDVGENIRKTLQELKV